MWLFKLLNLLDRQPDVELIRSDGTSHNTIRGDHIPIGTIVIEEDGRYFVCTQERDANGSLIFRENHKTCHYISHGE